MDRVTSPLLASNSAAATTSTDEEVTRATTIAQYGSVNIPSGSGSGDNGPVPVPVRSRRDAFLYDNRGLFFIVTAQLFGAIMGMFTRFLATSLPSGQRYHALQVLFARMSITWLCCMIWMWWNKVPHMPLGQRSIRGLLVVRGTTGFLGVVGLYCAFLTYCGVGEILY